MRTSASLLWASLLLALAACPPKVVVPHDAGVEDAGTSEVDAGFDAGTEVEDAGVEDAGPPPELRLNRLLPPRGATAGGTAVLLEGTGFLRGVAGSGTQAKPLTTLRIGGNQVQDFQIIDDETIEFRTPPGAVGAASVSMQNTNGNFVCNNCFTYFEELSVTGFTPREGPLAGGNELTLTGTGFTNDTQVNFGAFSSPRVTFVSATELKVIAPRSSVAGPVDLVVYNKNGVSNQRRAYTYQPRLVVNAVSPVAGPITGATTVTLTGSGFTGATAVTFGANAGTALTVVSDTQLTVVTPAAASGAVDVTVTTPAGTWVVKRGFSYFDPAGGFAAFALAPRLLRTADSVTLTGQALDQGALAVTIGGVVATVGARTFSTAEVTVPARGASPRVADVVVTGTSTVTLTGGATWRVALTELSPSTGPAAGGTAATLTAANVPPAIELTVGTFAATGVTVNSETSVALTTPAGSGGAPSDVRVVDSSDVENDATLVGGFTFLEPLSIGRVQPERGAIAGGTLVTVLGSGFGESTLIRFGTGVAKDFKLVDSHTVTCRTPKANVGVVDVKVERLGEMDTLPGGFSFFDPRSISGGLSGGPMSGTLNVTVLNSSRDSYGAPVPNAKVIIGVDPTTPFQGETDHRGQITFSDTTLLKAEIVTVYKDLFESATVTGVNAENLTVFIAPTGGGEPGNPGGGQGVPPSVIAGRVAGFKAPRPLMPGETLEARVFVAQTSLYDGPPFDELRDRSSEKWRIVNDGGDYLVYTGAGLRAVYAVLGIARGVAFTPVAMGIRRGITTSPDNPATGRDIIIDMALDLSVPITIDSPLEFEGPLGPEPGFNRIYSWLELGAEGFVPNPNNTDTGMIGGTIISSAAPTLTMPHLPRLDGSNFIFMNESSGSARYPVSYYFRRQPGNLATGVTIGPMLPAPNITAPITSFGGTVSWTMAPGPVPDLHNIQIRRVITPRISIVVWNLVVPGAETQVVLPQAAVDKLNREEAGNQLFVAIFSSRSPRFAYNQWTYDTLSGVSWSSYTIALSNGFVP